jgi:hypothetical protein
VAYNLRDKLKALVTNGIVKQLSASRCSFTPIAFSHYESFYKFYSLHVYLAVEVPAPEILCHTVYIGIGNNLGAGNPLTLGGRN